MENQISYNVFLGIWAVILSAVFCFTRSHNSAFTCSISSEDTTENSPSQLQFPTLQLGIPSTLG